MEGREEGGKKSKGGWCASSFYLRRIPFNADNFCVQPLFRPPMVEPVQLATTNSTQPRASIVSHYN